MKKFSLRPKNHIKSHPDLHNYECTICFDIEPFMMRCKGPCKSSLCLKCATSMCLNGYGDNCPKRCSNPLKLEPNPNFSIQFDCPYDRGNCKESIDGLQAFKSHCITCDHLTKEGSASLKIKQQHICHNGHSLLFIDANISFKESLNLNCAQCREKKICRSYCKECSSQDRIVVFCNDCRCLPCTKDVCPIGHELVKKQLKINSIYCDLCGFCVYLYSTNYYHDSQCNFSLCELCYGKLPDNHPLVPLQSNLEHMQIQSQHQSEENSNSQQFIEMDSHPENDSEMQIDPIHEEQNDQYSSEDQQMADHDYSMEDENSQNEQEEEEEEEEEEHEVNQNDESENILDSDQHNQNNSHDLLQAEENDDMSGQ